MYSRPVTAKQRELLERIARWKQNSGRWPSFREMAKQLGISVFAVQKRVAILRRDGFLGVSGKRFGFYLTAKGEALVRASEEGSFLDYLEDG